MIKQQQREPALGIPDIKYSSNTYCLKLLKWEIIAEAVTMQMWNVW